MRYRITVAALAVCAMMAAACAPIGTNPIALEYTPANFLTPAPGAEGVAVQILVNDNRTDKSRLGNVEDSTGAPIAPILATSSVTDTLEQAIASGLATRGFNVIASAPVTIAVDIRQFDCQFQHGTLSGSASAQMAIDVQVARTGGKPLYSQRFTGAGSSSGFESASSDNAKPALDRALSAAVNQLINDPGFIGALDRASRAPA
jgi:uncharacterized lipoprotein YajG